MINVERSDGGQTSGPPTLILGGGGLVKCAFLALFKTHGWLQQKRMAGLHYVRTLIDGTTPLTGYMDAGWHLVIKTELMSPFFLSDGPF